MPLVKSKRSMMKELFSSLISLPVKQKKNNLLNCLYILSYIHFYSHRTTPTLRISAMRSSGVLSMDIPSIFTMKSFFMRPASSATDPGVISATFLMLNVSKMPIAGWEELKKKKKEKEKKEKGRGKVVS